MARKWIVFLGLSLAGWFAAAALGVQLSGDESVWLISGAALALVMVPMFITLVLIQWALRGSPENQLLAVLGGTGIRMAVVSVAAILLYLEVPDLHRPGFLYWVIGLYLVTLTLEVVLVVRELSSQG